MVKLYFGFELSQFGALLRALLGKGELGCSGGFFSGGIFGRLELFKRITLIVEGGRIRKVFYPVFPPDRNAAEVISWLHASA